MVLCDTERWDFILKNLGFTTPDAPQFQQRLFELYNSGAKAVSVEATSHGLDQGRLNSTKIDIAVFTNLTQDHLDYHGNMEAYEAAKTKLFDWPSLRTVVINRDDAMGRRLIEKVSGQIHTITYGIEEYTEVKGDLHLAATKIEATSTGTKFRIISSYGSAEISAGLIGTFNVSNLLAVLGTLLAANIPFKNAIAELCKLKPVTGRMQMLGGEPLIVIDYAHTPDALKKTLEALKPINKSRKGSLLCVFGCGGNCDSTKRPVMGEIAEMLANKVVVTSDNPRNEDPDEIIDQIVSGIKNPKKVLRMTDRAKAIFHAVHYADKNDVILIAGKGHETTQEIMGKMMPFSDQEHAIRAFETRRTFSNRKIIYNNNLFNSNLLASTEI